MKNIIFEKNILELIERIKEIKINSLRSNIILTTEDLELADDFFKNTNNEEIKRFISSFNVFIKYRDLEGYDFLYNNDLSIQNSYLCYASFIEEYLNGISLATHLLVLDFLNGEIDDSVNIIINRDELEEFINSLKEFSKYGNDTKVEQFENTYRVSISECKELILELTDSVRNEYKISVNYK